MHSSRSAMGRMKELRLVIFFWIVFGFLVLVLAMSIKCTDGSEIRDTWSKPLIASGFKPAEDQKPEDIPGEKLPPAGDPVLWGEGFVQDLIPVEILGLVTPDGEHWIKAWVAGDEVKFQRLEWATEPAAKESPWELVLAVEIQDSLGVGLGICWSPVRLSGIRIGLQGIAGVNANLGDPAGWGSVDLRASKQYGSFSIGCYGGYGVGSHSGVVFGLSAGLGF